MPRPAPGHPADLGWFPADLPTSESRGINGFGGAPVILPARHQCSRSGSSSTGPAGAGVDRRAGLVDAGSPVGTRHLGSIPHG